LIASQASSQPVKMESPIKASTRATVARVAKPISSKSIGERLGCDFFQIQIRIQFVRVFKEERIFW